MVLFKARSLPEIALTLQYEGEIDSFETEHNVRLKKG